MKNRILSLLLLLSTAFFFTACEKNEVDTPDVVRISNIYVLNYGTFGGTKSELSSYDESAKTIANDLYKAANGVVYNSNIQSAYVHGGLAYLVGNSGDKIDFLEASNLKVVANPLAGELVNPRYMVAEGGFAYVSCWGEVADWSKMEASYLAKINLSTRKVVKKIAIPGGLEGLIVAEGKIFAALYTQNKVAVVDPATDAVSYIEVSAIPQHFVQDYQGMLWVSLISSYTVPFAPEKLGLAQINPKTQTVSKFVGLPGIASSGYLQSSKDQKTVYVLGAESWPSTKSNINALDVTTQSFAAKPLIEGEAIINFGVNPISEKIYVLSAPVITENGFLRVYSPQGTLEDTETVGIYPQQVIFVPQQ